MGNSISPSSRSTEKSYDGDIMRALITGGTGFIGSNLALALAAKGHDIV